MESKDSPKKKKKVRIRKGSQSIIQPSTSESKPPKDSGPPRLLIVSSRAKGIGAIRRALRPNVVMVQYKYESSTLDGVLGLVAEALATRKAVSVQSVLEQSSIRQFLETLVENHVDRSWVNARLDLLGCPLGDTLDGGLVASAVEELVGLGSVGVAADLLGTGVPLARIGEDEEETLGGLYFAVAMLSPAAKLRSRLHQSTAAGYEKIRVVGKGAFGSAVLYRRKDDGSLVVIKEIDMHCLSAQERTLALNEVAVLSKLEHPNIISYFDSFEEDGVLMIEMEYAESGNLSQVLSKQEKPLEEKEIIDLFQQIVSAVRYLHDNNVLHRDLKTANIFLTKDKCIKVGDFGISKVMSTATQRHGAETVVGTPYYISPEMCEGKPYNEKSDVWALGCILYEMACLQRTFEGSNLPALVNKIMKGQYESVKGAYSRELKELIAELLSMDPAARPTAADLLATSLPRLAGRCAEGVGGVGEEAEEEGGRKRRSRSVLYSFHPHTAAITTIPGLPSRIRIRQISVSDTHTLLCTLDKAVWAWGDNETGALGLEDRERRSSPTLVPSLTGKAIVKVSAGGGFSIFCSENGIVMSCGRKDCIGQGPLDEDLLKPRLIDSLLSVDMVSVSAGWRHVVCVSREGAAWSWGWGGGGRLGTGLQQSEWAPVRLRLAPGLAGRAARAAFDASAILTDSGSVLAFGLNQGNKLGLNKRVGALAQLKLTKGEVEAALVPTPMRSLGSRVVDLSLGRNHSAVLLESGHVYLLGGNECGQLGRGNFAACPEPSLLKALADKVCVMIECGAYNSVAATADGGVYFWGLRGQREPSVVSQGAVSLAEKTGKAVGVVRPFRQDEEELDPEEAELGVQGGGDWIDASLPSARSAQLWKKPDGEAAPQLVLRLEEGASAASLSLAAVAAAARNILFLVDTTAPVPKKPHQRQHAVKGTLFQKLPNQGGASIDDDTDDMSRTSVDTKVQTWIRDELAQADSLPAPKADKKKEKASLAEDENSKLRMTELEARAARLEAEKVSEAAAAASHHSRLKDEISRLEDQLRDSMAAPLPDAKAEESPPPLRSRLCSLM